MVTLQLRDLGAAYGRRVVLSGIDTPAWHGGEVVSVIGPNAAGKSTLFKRIAGLIDGPGEVLLQGARRGADAIAYLPQDHGATAALTVYETVLLARKQGSGWAVGDAELRLIDEVLASLDLEDIAWRRLGELSGGQRQLASIAQALVREPEVVLMDEPTSALDLHRQIQVLAFMRQLARRRGMLVLIAMHDLNQALRFSDQTLVLHDGTACASGPCETVIGIDLLRRVYRVEARIERCSLGRSQVIVDAVSCATGCAGDAAS
jgi:iron complex transport system ATP-binding protein